ncbi:MAG: ATP-binding protein [Thermodesulfobacteriota bacterium]
MLPVFSHRPGSFRALVWTGFFCVTLPLAVALLNAGVFAGRFARRAAEAVQHASRVADDSRLLQDHVLSLERRARQFHVLGEEQLLRDYGDRREVFLQLLDRLARLLPSLEERAAAMRELEEAVFRFLTQGGPQPQGADAEALDRFAPLSALSREVLDASTRFSLEEAEAMQHAAAQARRAFLWQASALVPLTLLVSALFAALLARPIRQIDRGIQGLGSGRFDSPIVVRGPRDLEFLGERLDWLRLRLAELEAEKTRFLAHMSHELKTPLTAIREGAELLGEGVVGALTAEQREVASILRDSALRLQGLIENLLRFSVELARAEGPGDAWTEVAEVVEAVVADHRMASAAKALRVERDVEPVRVRGDRERVRVILDNLLSNAVKFTPRGGTVGIRVSRDGKEAVIDVGDTGPGIPAGERERIFEPFFQGAARGDGAVMGSGLGLSIVAEYAGALGGRAEAMAHGGPGALLRVRLAVWSEEDP